VASGNRQCSGDGCATQAPQCSVLRATLADLAQLPIDIEGETDHQAWGATLRLAIRHELTLYDAAYLELALRRNLPLASLDEVLRRAARAEKVKLVV